jgi:hypothetical protein
MATFDHTRITNKTSFFFAVILLQALYFLLITTSNPYLPIYGVGDGSTFFLKTIDDLYLG